MASRPTTPVPDECPVCFDALRAGHARVDWCARHGLCRECAERIYSGGDHRCPMCRVPWFELNTQPQCFPSRHLPPQPRMPTLTGRGRNIMYGGDPDSFIFGELPTNTELQPADVSSLYPNVTNTELQPADVYAALNMSVRARVAELLATDDDNALEDMTWAPEGDAPSDDDDDPYVRQWNADNADDVPPYVRYGVSF